MKKLLFVISATLIVMSCENPVRMETKVHEDGSLDKTVVLEADSIYAFHNMFGISARTGWEVTSNKIVAENSDLKYAIQFKKSFSSADEINKELDTQVDTLFHVHSSFDKRFRWFYTYIRYSETFKPIDRLKTIKSEDYFTIEDKSFIDRLPGEGRAVSKADSFYLEQLNEKIFNRYANWGMFEEQFDILKKVLQKNNVNKNWYDSLEAHRDFIYEKLDDMRGDPFFAMKMADSLKIPLPVTAKADFNAFSEDINKRVRFMTFARDGRYTNVIEMPWEVVHTNADSIAGSTVYWKPFVTKFAIQEYEMFAESRKINWWAIGVSLVVIGLAVFSFLKKK